MDNKKNEIEILKKEYNKLINDYKNTGHHFYKFITIEQYKNTPGSNDKLYLDIIFKYDTNFKNLYEKEELKTIKEISLHYPLKGIKDFIMYIDNPIEDDDLSHNVCFDICQHFYKFVYNYLSNKVILLENELSEKIRNI